MGQIMKNIIKILALNLVLFTGISAQQEIRQVEKAQTLESSKPEQTKLEQLKNWAKNNQKLQTGLKFSKTHKKKLIALGAFLAWCGYGYKNTPTSYRSLDNCTPASIKNISCFKRAVVSPIMPIITLNQKFGFLGKKTVEKIFYYPCRFLVS